MDIQSYTVRVKEAKAGNIGHERPTARKHYTYVRMTEASYSQRLVPGRAASVSPVRNTNS